MTVFGILLGDIAIFAAGVIAAVAVPILYRWGAMALAWLRDKANQA